MRNAARGSSDAEWRTLLVVGDDLEAAIAGEAAGHLPMEVGTVLRT